MNQYGRITTNEPQPHVNCITMIAMVHLLTPVDGYYTTFYNHIAMVLTPLRDPGKTMVDPHFILQESIQSNLSDKKGMFAFVCDPVNYITNYPCSFLRHCAVHACIYPL